MRAGLCLTILVFAISAYGQPVPEAGETLSRLSNVRIDANQIYLIRDLTIRRDVFSISFTRGAIAFLEPVDGRVTGAVFIGTGDIVAIPPDKIEKQQLYRYTKSPLLNESFESAIFRFTDGTGDEIIQAYQERAQEEVAADERAKLLSMNDEVRLRGASVNYRILSDLLGRSDRPLFMAQLQNEARGWFNATYDRRREEEVSVAKTAAGADQDVFWSSFPQRTPGRDPERKEKSPVDVLSYEIDAALNSEMSFEAKASLRLRARQDGDRVLTFLLSPSLRLNSAAAENGPPLAYNQAGNSFVVIWPEPLKADQEIALQVTYVGQAVEIARGSAMAVSRENWYPTVESSDRAQVSMTFHFPSPLNLMATGNKVRESETGGQRHSTWRSETEVSGAGFNLASCMIYGDETESPPLYTCLGNDAEVAKRLLDEARAVVKFFLRFGDFPYPRLTISPLTAVDARGGPSLIYAPLIPFLSTEQQKSAAVAESDSILMERQFVREIARQWFGQSLAARTYRDEWIMDGLAGYAAAMYMATKYPSQSIAQRLRDARAQLLERSPEEVSYDGLGPVWLGSRINLPRTTEAYLNVIENKSMWIMHMLRMAMAGDSGSDSDFLAVLADLRNRFGGVVSTAEFRAAVDPHLGDASDWFFDQWVFDTGIPVYALNYTVAPAPGGFAIKGRITQSGVPDGFVLPVPVYADEQLLGKVMVSDDDGAFQFTSRTRPQTVRIDPNGTVLAVVN